MDRNSQKKKDRQKQVKKKICLMRAAAHKERKAKEAEVQPIVKLTPYRKPVTALSRNCKVLKQMLAEHESMLKHREDHKEETEGRFQQVKEQSLKYQQLWKEVDDGNGT